MTVFRTLIVAAAAAAMATAAAAQSSDSEITSSSVTIFRPITLTKNSDLSFGTIVRPASGSGTVTIAAADGTRSVDNGITALSTGPNAAAGRATFTVDGEGGQTFSITVPATFIMNRSGGGSITVTVLPSATTGLLSGALGDASSGTAAFGVGGSIPVASTTLTGAYAGTFTTTVAYN